MKFDMIARFRETIPMVKSVSSSEIKKFISDFDRNYHFTLLSRIRIFRGFTPSSFINKSKTRFLIIIVYVDDLNLVGTPEELTIKAKYLKSEFMKDLGKIKNFIRLRIENFPIRVFVH